MGPASSSTSLTANATTTVLAMPTLPSTETESKRIASDAVHFSVKWFKKDVHEAGFSFTINGRTLIDLSGCHSQKFGVMCTPLDLCYSPNKRMIAIVFDATHSMFIDLDQPRRGLKHTPGSFYPSRYFVYPYLPEDIPAKKVLGRVGRLAESTGIVQFTEVVSNRHGVLARFGNDFYWASPQQDTLIHRTSRCGSDRFVVHRATTVSDFTAVDFQEDISRGEFLSDKILGGVDLIGYDATLLSVMWTRNPTTEKIDTYVNNELAVRYTNNEVFRYDPVRRYLVDNIGTVVPMVLIKELLELVADYVSYQINPEHTPPNFKMFRDNHSRDPHYNETGPQEPPSDSDRIHVRAATRKVNGSDESVVYLTRNACEVSSALTCAKSETRIITLSEMFSNAVSAPNANAQAKAPPKS